MGNVGYLVDVKIFMLSVLNGSTSRCARHSSWTYTASRILTKLVWHSFFENANWIIYLNEILLS
jgi:hypothetical protein